MLIQFDAEPRQGILDNLQTALQIIASINIEDLIDGVAINGEETTALLLGKELIGLLKVNGYLINAIDIEKHIDNIKSEVKSRLE